MIQRIGISTSVFDADGARVVAVAGDTIEGIEYGSRRVTRTATLDGGSAVYDTGFAASDADIIITPIESEKDIGDWFAYLVKNYSSVNVATPRGFYYATPSKVEVKNGLPILTLMITEQIV